ncbi:MAG: hypothetical protein HC874_07300 [Richelia sp. SL_2_1]|nr:hypothetical protein [Richelia sp. SM1_7_0]NJO27369.1 hypothetical protein [Richelia sp. SL_2_1]
MSETRYSLQINNDTFNFSPLMKRFELSELNKLHSPSNLSQYVDSTVIHKSNDFAIAFVFTKIDFLPNKIVAGVFNDTHILYDDTLFLKYDFDIASNKHYMGFTLNELHKLVECIRITAMSRFLLTSTQTQKHFLKSISNIHKGNK